MRVAVYARYSTDAQKETSIDDQIRTCEEVAKRYGWQLSRSLIFADDAITGAAKATHKREQYHALQTAIKARQVDVIICDQQCRLARSARESLNFFDELKVNGVRLLTADGFDSLQTTAQLLFGMKSVFAEFFLDETRHRVLRGMVGEFERGAMVTAVPYGYEVDAERSSKEGRSLWKIHSVHSQVVKEIFEWRRMGKSLSQIAAELNRRQVATPQPSRASGLTFWRQSGVCRILQNPIYKGLYEVRFAGENGREGSVAQRFMPELTLIEEPAWRMCQSHSSGVRLKGQYGGGKHALSGVFSCGKCGVPLSTHHSASDNGSLHCIQCEHASKAGVPDRKAEYVSIKGARHLLSWLLKRIVTGDALERFRSSLKGRLAAGGEGELAVARQKLEKAQAAQKRLAVLLGRLNNDDPVIEQQYLESREAVCRLSSAVANLEAGMRQTKRSVIQRQLEVDLSCVLDNFLSEQQSPERTRAILRRIFPSIVLKKKLDRYTAIFKVEVKPGAMLAEASGTEILIDGNVVLWVKLQTSGSKFPTWSIQEVDPGENAD